MSGRLVMNNIKEILRLKYELKLTHRQIAHSVKSSPSSISVCLARARACGIQWPLDPTLDDQQLETLLYGKQHQPNSLYRIDFQGIQDALRKKGITLFLLWEEYKQANPKGVSYSQFCRLYQDWQGPLKLAFHHTYKAGEKVFVDYSGLTMPWVDQHTGEITCAEIFVAVLGASDFIYVEACASQQLADWIQVHIHLFEYLQGVPEIVVPDNLKSAVTKAHWYEPAINRTYQEMATHYGVAVIPTRAASPRDKGKVEKAVQHIQRQILARLRHHTFFNLHELNEAIKKQLTIVNNKPFQKSPDSRQHLFERIEKPALNPLPTSRYMLAHWKKAKLGLDYHIVLEKHYYSVPYQYVKKTVDVRYTAMTVEIFYQGNRIASHKKSKKTGYTTDKTHMPPNHQAYANWSPERILNWLSQSGHEVKKVGDMLMTRAAHPAQAFRSCLGIKRLSKSYGHERLALACQRALTLNTVSYKSIHTMLKNNLESQSLPQTSDTSPVVTTAHDYLRGNTYFN